MPIEPIQGNTDNPDCSVGIVVARWNSFITESLLEGALQVLKSKGVPEEQITVVYCPGAYEIPLTARKLLQETDGVITLGAVIRGDTPHFDYVCDAVNLGVMKLNMTSDKPVVFGVLTTDTVEQARERVDSNSSKGNKGSEVALALLEMISVVQQIDNL